MPSRAEIVSFDDSPPPPGANPWVVAGSGPGTGIEVTEPDPAWPRQYDRLAGRIRQALGGRVLQLEHVGSTSVPGLAAKPVIDIDLTVADPGRERDYVRALAGAGRHHPGRDLDRAARWQARAHRRPQPPGRVAGRWHRCCLPPRALG